MSNDTLLVGHGDALVSVFGQNQPMPTPNGGAETLTMPTPIGGALAIIALVDFPPMFYSKVCNK